MDNLVGQISKIQRFIGLVLLQNAPEAAATGLVKIVGDVLIIIKQSDECGKLKASLLSSLL